jgi:hypothetical protein
MTLAIAGGMSACGGTEAGTLEKDSEASSDLLACRTKSPPPATCGEWSCDPVTRQWGLIPYDYGTVCNTIGHCDGQGSCVMPPPASGTVVPNFYVTHVVYAVPGKSSNVNYSAGFTSGSSTTTEGSWKNSISASVKAGTDLILSKESLTVSAGVEWGSTTSKQTDVVLTLNSAYKKVGWADGVNHNDDEIWFLPQPSIDVAIQPAYDIYPTSVSWQFSSNQPLTPYVVLVGWLNGAYAMPSDVSNALNHWGITPAFYSQMLKTDPFVNGLDPNTALDPTRFELVNAFPYEPVPAPGDAANTQTFSINRSTTNSTAQKSTVTYTAGLTYSGSGSFYGLFEATLTVADKLTFGSSSSSKDSTGTSMGESITVGQPPFGYTGPTVMRVYEDKVWKTFVFTLDWF